MADKTTVGVVGLGKMGMSHLALINAHPETRTIACDASGLLIDTIGRYSAVPICKDYMALLQNADLDAVVIATPTRLHAPMVRAALQAGLHVFCEKPFCLDWQEAQDLAALAQSADLVNQVGYHYRHVGAFQRMVQIVQSGALGRISHVLAEAYGPVVLQPKRRTWRSRKDEGGGCLYDYAAHPLNLLNWMFGPPQSVHGSMLDSVFSHEIDDQVASTLTFPGGTTAQVSVNWSDAAQRKMTTRMTLIGSNGRLFADRQECQLFLRMPVDVLPDAPAGWSVRYTTDLTEDPWFYLRGEEYSHQIDDFIQAIRGNPTRGIDASFSSAAETDRTIAMILNDHDTMAETGERAFAPQHAPAARDEKSRRWRLWA